MIALLAAHTGAHAAAHAAPVAVLPQIFRRAIAAVRRKLAVPAGVAAGAATTLLADRWPCCVHCASGSPCEPQDNHPIPCSDGCNGVLRDRMLSQVRAERDARPFKSSALLTDAELAALDAKVDAALVRRPVNGRTLGDHGTLPRRQPGATLPYVEPLVDRGPEKPPWQTQAMPVYGQAPVERVLEAERLAGAMLP